jgi:hypothetical protein
MKGFRNGRGSIITFIDGKVTEIGTTTWQEAD